LLIAITGKFPDPAAVNPVMFGVLAAPVQAKVVPTGEGAQVTTVVLAPEQMACVKEALVMVGVGLTVTENVEGVPGQLLKVGNTEMVPTIVPGVLLLVLLGAVHGEICPAPDTPKPIFALVFVHVKVAPTGFETKALGLIVDPGQVTIGLNGPTLATGFIKAITLIGEPTQEAAVGVTVYVTLAIVLLLFVSTWLIAGDGFTEF
jgi:hypothetical protein